MVTLIGDYLRGLSEMWALNSKLQRPHAQGSIGPPCVSSELIQITPNLQKQDFTIYIDILGMFKTSFLL